MGQPDHQVPDEQIKVSLDIKDILSLDFTQQAYKIYNQLLLGGSKSGAKQSKNLKDSFFDHMD